MGTPLPDDETPLVTPPAGDVGQDGKPVQTNKNPMALLISFLLMVVIGLGNKIFSKLQSLPMNNYPYFLSLYVSFLYIPLSFMYIIPMILFGNQITPEQRAIPLYKFAIMGALDGVAGIMQTFATNFISGTLMILLQQAAIPVSMVASRILLKVKYEIQHYIGAFIVFCGLLCVLVPIFVHPTPDPNAPHHPTSMIIAFSVVMILSCIPMAASSVYKEKALGEQDVDVIYLNGWVAVFQVIISIILAIPAAYAIGLTIKEIPTNFWNGARCYAGINSIHTGLNADKCHDAPLYVNLYIGFNILYNILIIMILKYGSSNILWLALTLMVPLGFAAFSIKFVPDHQAMKWENILGLVIILAGLVMYRLFGPAKVWYQNRQKSKAGYNHIQENIEE